MSEPMKACERVAADPIGASVRVRVMTAIGCALALYASGCCEEGSGTIVRENRSVAPFNRVRLDVPGVARLVQGPPTPLRIRTDDNIMDRLETSVRDGALVIEADEDEERCLEPTEFVVEVSTEEIRQLVIDGSGDIVLPKPVDTDALSVEIDGSGSVSAALVRADDVSVEIDGSGDVDLRVEAGTLRSSIDGSGDVAIAGSAAEHDIVIDGSGDIDASSLQTATTRIEIDGSGGCAVAADDLLEVTIDGSGDVSYCGDPEVRRSIDGSGSVERAGPSACD